MNLRYILVLIFSCKSMNTNPTGYSTPPASPRSQRKLHTPPRPRRQVDINSSAAISESKLPPSTTQETSRDKISLLTWNVWFGNYRQTDRYLSIVSQVLSLDPDVACFQEVTRPFLSALKSNAEILERYQISSNPIYDYGILSIVKKELNGTFVEVDLPSRMGRSLLVTEFSLSNHDKNLAVGNVHLESLDNEQTRRDQLIISSGYLSDNQLYHPNSLLVGDFNFDCSQTWGDWNKSPSAHRRPEDLENNVLSEVMPDWTDSWPHLKGMGDGADPGITFDGSTNPKCVQDKKERMRYDRVMIHNVNLTPQIVEETKESILQLVPESIEMVGTNAIDEIGLKPSDHYGLFINLKIIQK